MDFLRARVEGITIITDIIAGFPTETEEDWAETMELVEKYRFPSLFINQFFPRPGTPAAKMKRIDTVEVKRRTKQLSAFFHTYFPYEDRIGQVYRVLVTETSHDGNYYVGHNEKYEQVLVPKREELMGKMFEVEIVSTCKFSMTGQLLDDTAVVRPAPRDPLVQGQLSGASLPLLQSSDDNYPNKRSSLLLPSCVALLLAVCVRLLYHIL